MGAHISGPEYEKIKEHKAMSAKVAKDKKAAEKNGALIRRRRGRRRRLGRRAPLLVRREGPRLDVAACGRMWGHCRASYMGYVTDVHGPGVASVAVYRHTGVQLANSSMVHDPRI